MAISRQRWLHITTARARNYGGQVLCLNREEDGSVLRLSIFKGVPLVSAKPRKLYMTSRYRP